MTNRKRKSLTVHMSEDLFKRFIRISKQEGKTRSHIILEMLESYCEDIEK